MNLLDEIKKRTQGQDEKLVQYISSMQSLFRKLSVAPLESEQVRIMRCNLIPYLNLGLALKNITTIEDLLCYGRNVEDA